MSVSANVVAQQTLIEIRFQHSLTANSIKMILIWKLDEKKTRWERHMRSVLLRWIINLATDHRSIIWIWLRTSVKSEKSKIQMHSKQHPKSLARISRKENGQKRITLQSIKVPSSPFLTEISLNDIFWFWIMNGIFFSKQNCNHTHVFKCRGELFFRV